MQKYDAIENGIAQNDVRALREAIGSICYTNRDFSDGEFFEVISYVESKGIQLKDGKTMQFTNENKTVKDLLSTIDKQIERLQRCESYGAFNCATYVISSDPETNAIVSSGYNALMRGDNSSLQASHINNWNVHSENGKLIKEYLMKFSHPLFISPLKGDVLLSPASISNSYELAVNMGLPKKSINGLPVFEMASFGRNVFETTISNEIVPQIKLVILSILVDTFISKISFPMQPGPEIGSISDA